MSWAAIQTQARDAQGSAGTLLVAALMLPSIGAVLAFWFGGRWAARIAGFCGALGLVIALLIAVQMRSLGAALSVPIGGWLPPLGIALRADGLSAALLLTGATIVCAVVLFAWRQWQPAPSDAPAEHGSIADSRRSTSFWTLLLGTWAGLNTVLLANDLFTLFVALELLTFAAVPLTSLEGKRNTIGAALRYLLFALLGSMLYLLGVALVYGAFGTLDITLLAGRLTSAPAGVAALVLMTAGMLAKAAVFPFHIWLPPAHAGAPAAASAVLSALVVKGPFVVTARLWFDLAPDLLGGSLAQLLAAMGASGILFGSVMAARAPRLKLLVAYSTVAQVGYLFLAFALTVGISASIVGPASVADARVVTGATLQAVSHAFAKAAMFMAVGLIAEALGHDRVAGLGGLARFMPLTVLAILVAGLSLMGVPPSGGFWAKWLLLTAAVETGQWWWALVMLCGGLLTGAYLLRIVGPAFLGGEPSATASAARQVSAAPQWAALGLALISLLLGLLAVAAIGLIEIGRSGLGAITGGGS